MTRICARMVCLAMKISIECKKELRVCKLVHWWWSPVVCACLCGSRGLGSGRCGSLERMNL